MRRLLQSRFLFTALCTLALVGCQPKKAPSAAQFAFEATLAIVPPANEPAVAEEDVAEELQVRAEARGLQILIDPDHPDDGRLLLYLNAANQADAGKLAADLCFSARLELRAVYPGNNPTIAEEVRRGDNIVPGHKLHQYIYTDIDGISQRELLLLSKRTSITGKDVKQAHPDPARAGIVNVQLTGKGAAQMERLTRSMAKGRDRIAILLNDEVISAPVVQDTLSGQFIIQGLANPAETRALAASLMAPLSTELEVESVRALKPAP